MLLLYWPQEKLIFVEIQVSYSASVTVLVRWHAGAVNLPPSYVIFAQLAYPMNGIILPLHQDNILKGKGQYS
jgi:hypothetical protein